MFNFLFFFVIFEYGSCFFQNRLVRDGTTTPTPTTLPTTTPTLSTTGAPTTTLNLIDESLANKLVGWWKLDGNFEDSSSSSHDLTAVSVIEGADTAASLPGFGTGTTDFNPTAAFYGPLGEESAVASGAISDTFTSINMTLGASVAVRTF